MTFTIDQVRAQLRREFESHVSHYRHSTGLRGWCAAKGIKHPGPVTDFLNGRRGSPPEVLTALGLEYAIVKRRA